MHLRKGDLAAAVLGRPVFRGKSQAQIAISVGIDQSQVSRVLTGRYIGIPQSVKKLCEYAQLDWKRFVTAPDPTESHLLMDALKSTWNGTEKQERLLARIIRACRNG
jgi:transcriptional regulator with XRE-family HTH domain